jgi:multidrug efflux pump subunit AcrB
MTAFTPIAETARRQLPLIMLTTMTTFGGLTPIILETSQQAYQLIPMAISLGFGIAFATAIILVILPCPHGPLARLIARRGETGA